MHNSVKITIFLPTPFLQGGVILIFPCSLYSTTYLVEHPGCLSSHCGLLGILRSNFAIFWSKQRSPTREQRGAITALYLVIIYIEVLGVVYKFIYLLLFYKPIQGSSKFMRPCMYLSTVDVSLVRSEYFYLCLSARPFLGLFGKVDSPPVFFCQDWHGRLLPIIVLFYKVYINTLDICLHWLFSRVRSGQSLEGSAPFLRFFFFFGVSDVFGGGSEVVRESFQSLPRELAYLYRPISLGISTLVSGSLSVLPLV